MYLTTMEVAKKLNVRYLTVYYWVKKGILPAIQIGRDYKIDEQDLIKLLKTKKVDMGKLK